MLIIAIGHGKKDKPFISVTNAVAGKVDPRDPLQCLSYVGYCQSLKAEEVDELLVVELPRDKHDPELTYHYTSDKDWNLMEKDPVSTEELTPVFVYDFKEQDEEVTPVFQMVYPEELEDI